MQFQFFIIHSCLEKPFKYFFSTEVFPNKLLNEISIKEYEQKKGENSNELKLKLSPEF